ncbi:chemotaxis protein CheB, partial [Sphingobacterium sp. T2]|uniref:chemotaxis protein CheB n=1 Tax=Sphingobacterium sp. T2 TaxID=1590596 RepID=UPI0029349A41
MSIAKEIILVGGSAGSYPLITTFLGQLPSYFEQAICIVLHRNKKFETQIREQFKRKRLQRNITSGFSYYCRQK